MRPVRRPPAAATEARTRCTAGLVAAACLAVLAAPAAALVVEFPGPVPIPFAGSTLCAVPVGGDPGDRLVVGTANRDLTLVQYVGASGTFATMVQVPVVGEPVALLPVRDAGGTVATILAAVRDPDRVVTLRVSLDEPYLAVEASLDLPEDPGGLALVAPGLAVVTLPGVDRVAWLDATAGAWRLAGQSDAGDRPGAVVAADLDGDGVAEVAVANGGVLSRSLMIFRRGEDGYALDLDLPLQATPAGLAAGDVDGDGRDELAVSSTDTALVWVLAAADGTLVETARVAPTVAADGVHLAALPGGAWGL
ncbi:MAG: VCBS repeat-containing protein, partial [Candidatus Krumholzibacteriia bacterium]